MLRFESFHDMLSQTPLPDVLQSHIAHAASRNRIGRKP